MTNITWTSLNDLETGKRAVVRQLRGGREFAGRLAALGFTIGVEISVIQNYGRGPITVSIRETRIALGRGEAGKVRVEAVSSDG
jgi:ferrous iron transport protein A